MAAKLPRGVEPKKGFTFSCEESWKQRFIIACHEKSELDGNDIVASRILRQFVIKTTLDYETDIQKRKRRVPA